MSSASSKSVGTGKGPLPSCLAFRAIGAPTCIFSIQSQLSRCHNSNENIKFWLRDTYLPPTRSVFQFRDHTFIQRLRRLGYVDRVEFAGVDS